jgi:glutathione synthase
VVNHPRGIRNNNEKLSILHFPDWIPKTMVSTSPKEILDFQKKLKAPVIVKPLDQKGGTGIFLIRSQGRAFKRRLAAATAGGTKALMAQAFINTKKKIEKRIFVLGGRILTLYEKRPKGREFRANLGLGATWHPSRVSPREKALVSELRPWLLRERLDCVGLDVLNGKLIEINVTCPAGITEARFLGLRPDPLAAWADFLEAFPRRRTHRL